MQVQYQPAVVVLGLIECHPYTHGPMLDCDLFAGIVSLVHDKRLGSYVLMDVPRLAYL